MTRKILRRLPPLHRLPDWTIFLLFFVYSLGTGLLIQLVLLPYVFPAWHAGEGLLVGLDSRGFHRMAFLLAMTVEQKGWGSWMISSQPVAGIASLFYIVIAPHPWSVLPLNAALHALAGFALYKTLRFFLEERRDALLATLPLVLFPSALSWVAQMHNDNYAVTGGVLMLHGWVCLTRQESWKSRRLIAAGVLAFLAGAVLIWLVREYVVIMYAGVGALMLLPVLVIFLIRGLRRRWKWRQVLAAGLVTCLTFSLSLSLLTINLGKAGVRENKGFLESLYSPELDSQDGLVDEGPGPLQLLLESEEEEATESAEPGLRPRQIWQPTPWLPSWVDAQFKELAIRRARALTKLWTETRGASNIDNEVVFRNVGDLAAYLPRATEIGFFSPFPADWFGQGSKAPNTMMRRMAGLEMAFCYLALAGLVYALFRWRRQPEMWIGFLFCTGMLLIYVYGTPNLGTLYRLRYPYYMSLIGFGTAGLISAVRDLVTRRRKPHRKPGAPAARGGD